VILIITNGCVLGFDISYTPPGDGDNSSIDISILEKQTAAAGGLALVVGILGLLWESLAILLRFLNIGYLNQRAKFVLAVVSSEANANCTMP